jgi:hypothetical protein
MKTDERELPPVGKWMPHDGGPRPVPKGTKCNVFLESGKRSEYPSEYWDWQDGIVAFCVTEYPDEEETRTGECWAYHYRYTTPTLVENEVGERCVKGTYTATIVNGKPKRIVWEADE